MATESDADVPTALTKDYIKRGFAYLEEIHDADKRNIFFTEYMVENVAWEVMGTGHSMAGIRHSVTEHTTATFARMRTKIINPIRFVVTSIVLEPETRTACVELRGYATRLNGQPYDNDYVWITHWNEEGKIWLIRSYHDTNLAEQVLNEEV